MCFSKTFYLGALVEFITHEQVMPTPPDVSKICSSLITLSLVKLLSFQLVGHHGFSHHEWYKEWQSQLEIQQCSIP